MAWILNSRAVFTLLCVAATVFTISAVNLDKYDKLSFEQLIELDKEVSRFYDLRYTDLDHSNVTYDEQLLSTIKSIMHTVVVHHQEFAYSDEQVMRKSEGKKLDKNLCKNQVKALAKILKELSEVRAKQDGATVPISAIDFLESNGRSESAVLNGNLWWPGSEASCLHGLIKASSVEKYLSPEGLRNDTVRQADIIGRYCVAHLRAKTWPKDDIYFGERLHLNLGLCLPESCHSSCFLDLGHDFRSDIDFLSRSTLTPPFDSNNYEISYLYCFPDEDSEHRQLDFGAKAFIVFNIIWIILTIHLNRKYQLRLITIEKLRQSVDFRMIIGNNYSSDLPEEAKELIGVDEGRPKQIRTKQMLPSQDTTSNERQGWNLQHPEKEISSGQETTPIYSGQNLLSPSSNQGSRHSSNSPTPLASDVEDNDGDFNQIRPFVIRKPTNQGGTNNLHSDSHSKVATSVDWVQAFSLVSNLSYLFKFRGGKVDSTEKSKDNEKQKRYNLELDSSHNTPRRYRVSQANQSFIDDLERQNSNLSNSIGKTKSRVEIVSSKSSESTEEETGNLPRINIRVFDGIKTIATCYIVFSHVLMFFFGVVVDLKFASERMMDFTIIGILNGLQVVSLFYIITGLLISYLTFSRQKLKQLLQPSFWLLVIVGRYLRLIPAYFLVFWFVRHVSPYMGSGSEWMDYRTDKNHVRTYCSNQSWWIMLTMSSADVKIPYDCIPQAWYLSNDFKTLFVLPFYIAILAINAKAGYLAILSTLIYSFFRLFYILRGANVDYKILLEWKPHVFGILSDRLHPIYTDLGVRLSPYLVGVALGHLLYLYDLRKIKKWPRFLEVHGIKVALFVGMITFFGAPIMDWPMVNQFLPARKNISSDMVVLMIPIFKTAMEGVMGILLLRLTTGGGYKWVVNVLSSKMAKILSNISYAVFLVHIEIMYKMPSCKYSSNYWYLFLYSTFCITLSHIVAFVVYVFYEMPIHNITRSYVRKIFRLVVK